MPGIDRIVVATDDERIAEAARATDADVVMSTGEFASGTDRVAAAASQYTADVIVNVQGDELLLDAESVGAAVARFRDSAYELGTLRARLADRQDLWDPNVVKVVIDDNEQALFFSRAPLPFPRAAWQATVTSSPGQEAAAVWPRLVAEGEISAPVYAHIGVYFYRPEALRRWATMKPSRLEEIEGLEQLRVLEAGERMQTYPVAEAIPGVNTPADLERALAALTAAESTSS